MKKINITDAPECSSVPALIGYAVAVGPFLAFLIWAFAMTA